MIDAYRFEENRYLTVLGIDPALRNFGFALAKVDVVENKIVEIKDLILVKTHQTKDTKQRRNSADLQSAKTLTSAVRKLTEQAFCSFAEVPIGSQSARAMASYGICIGILSGSNNEIFEVTPTEVKKRATGLRTATKEEMINWAVTKFPDAPWLKRKVKGQVVLKNENEHLADAVGAINAGLHNTAWLELRGALLYVTYGKR